MNRQGNPERTGLKTILSRADAASRTSDYAGARDGYAMAANVLREGGEPSVLALVLNNLGIAAARSGEHEAAVAALKESIQVSTRIPDLDGVRRASGNLAALASDRGDYVNALAAHARNLEIAVLGNDVAGQVLALLSLSWSQLRLGVIDASQSSISRAIDALREAPHPKLLPNATLAQGRIELCCRRLDSARTLFRWVSMHSEGDKESLPSAMSATCDVVAGIVGAVDDLVAITSRLIDVTYRRAAAHRLLGLAASAGRKERAALLEATSHLAAQLNDRILLAETICLRGPDVPNFDVPAEEVSMWLRRDQAEIQATTPCTRPVPLMPWISGVDIEAVVIPQWKEEVTDQRGSLRIGPLKIRPLDSPTGTIWSIFQS